MKTLTLTTKQIGAWDKGGRYTLHGDYVTESARYIRSPSRAWPYSIYKHVHTQKYAKQLALKLGVEQVIII